MIASVLDARKGEVYFALFRREKASITRLTPDSVMSIDSAVNLVRETCTNRSEELLLIGDGTKAHGRRLVDAVGLPARTAGGVYPSIASQGAMLATPRFTNASGDDGGALTPVYLRLAEAESKRKIQASF